MTLEEIRQLIDVLNESGIAELEVQRGENRVRIRRNANASEMIVPALAPASAQPATAAFAAAAPGNSTAFTLAASAAAAAAAEEDTTLVKSPIVGTYYDAPSPDSPPFVKVGDAVRPGQVLCIIESMKLMNEIEAEIAGVIVSKMVENGHPVEYGEGLFAVRPS